jgi:hypothetical protein
LVLGVFIALALTLTLVSVAGATKPNPDHKATICHAHPADTAAAGFASITVDVASVGYVQAGHQSEHDADIIPAYEYTDVNGATFSFYGKNLGTLFFGTTGLTILNNGCQLLDPSEDPSPTPEQSIGEPSFTENPSPSDPASSQPEASAPGLSNTALSGHGGVTDDGWLLIYGTLMVIILGSAFVSAARAVR